MRRSRTKDFLYRLAVACAGLLLAASTLHAQAGFATGSFGGAPATPPGAGSIQRYEFQLAGGNNTFGNNTPYAANVPVVNEIMTNGGTIQHLSCRNLTGGVCTTAPTFNVYKIHAAGETDGTQLLCSNTQQAKGAVSTQAETLTWVAGDEIGIYIVTPGGTCTAPIFDVDILVTEP